MSRSYPRLHPQEEPKGTALPAEAPDVRCYGELERERERGAFCEASDKPCSQSRAGSGIISGSTRGRNPSSALWIGFLFTRAWSLDSSNQSGLRGRLETGRQGERERGFLKQPSCPRLSVYLSVSLHGVGRASESPAKERRSRMQRSHLNPAAYIFGNDITIFKNESS